MLNSEWPVPDFVLLLHRPILYFHVLLVYTIKYSHRINPELIHVLSCYKNDRLYTRHAIFQIPVLSHLQWLVIKNKKSSKSRFS